MKILFYNTNIPFYKYMVKRIGFNFILLQFKACSKACFTGPFFRTESQIIIFCHNIIILLDIFIHHYFLHFSDKRILHLMVYKAISGSLEHHKIMKYTVLIIGLTKSFNFGWVLCMRKNIIKSVKCVH